MWKGNISENYKKIKQELDRFFLSSSILLFHNSKFWEFPQSNPEMKRSPANLFCWHICYNIENGKSLRKKINGEVHLLLGFPFLWGFRFGAEVPLLLDQKIQVIMTAWNCPLALKGYELHWVTYSPVGPTQGREELRTVGICMSNSALCPRRCGEE